MDADCIGPGAEQVPRILQQAAQGIERRDDDIGFGRREFFHRVVSGEHSNAHHAAVARRFDIVDHVADEGGFTPREPVLVEDLSNLGPLVHHAGIRMLEVMAQPELGRLHVEMLLLHRAEKEKTTSARPAEIEEFVEPGQGRDLVLDLDKTTVKDRVELGQRNIGKKFLVELGEGQPEVLPEFVAGQRRLAELLEHVVRRADDRRQIVNQRAGPIEEKIAQHGQQYLLHRTTDDTNFTVGIEGGDERPARPLCLRRARYSAQLLLQRFGKVKAAGTPLLLFGFTLS